MRSPGAASSGECPGAAYSAPFSFRTVLVLRTVLVRPVVLRSLGLVLGRFFVVAGRLGNRDRFGQGRGDRHALLGPGIDAVAERIIRLIRRGVPRSGIGLTTAIAVADRYPVVVRVDLAEGEEAVPVPAIFDKRRLQRRLDPRYLREIDVSFYLLFGRRLEIEFLEPIAVEHHDPSLLGVGGIDKHTLRHSGRTPRPAAALVFKASGGAVFCMGKPVVFAFMASRISSVASRRQNTPGFELVRSAPPGAATRRDGNR